jgi:hypothetical protein
MADDSLLGRLAYEFPYFEDYLEPKGALKLDRACHACFYYGMLATKARGNAGPIETQIIQYKVGEQIPDWREPRDLEIARSVAILYGLESPDEFLKYKKEAWYQAKLLGVELDPTIFEISPRIIN